VSHDQPLRVKRIEVIVLAEAEFAQQCFAAFQSLHFGKSCLAGSQIVEVERLSRQQNDILKLGLAVLQQIAPQLRQTDRGHGGDAKNRNADHHQQLVGYP
jgi:hypothetical protein